LQYLVTYTTLLEFVLTYYITYQLENRWQHLTLYTLKRTPFSPSQTLGDSVQPNLYKHQEMIHLLMPRIGNSSFAIPAPVISSARISHRKSQSAPISTPL